MPIQTHYRACNLCEAICGLAITYRTGPAGTEIISIAGDKEDSCSRVVMGFLAGFTPKELGEMILTGGH